MQIISNSSDVIRYLSELRLVRKELVVLPKISSRFGPGRSSELISDIQQLIANFRSFDTCASIRRFHLERWHPSVCIVDGLYTTQNRFFSTGCLKFGSTLIVICEKCHGTH